MKHKSPGGDSSFTEITAKSTRFPPGGRGRGELPCKKKDEHPRPFYMGYPSGIFLGPEQGIVPVLKTHR